MTTVLTHRQQRFAHDARRFAQEVIAPRVERMETTHQVEEGLVREMAARGWLGLTISRRFGGLAAGHLAKTVLLEEISAVSGAMGAALQASQLGAAMIINLGSGAQKRRWLPRIAAGECLPTIAVTERGSGGHVAAMATEAVRHATGWTLSGHKLHVGNSTLGDLHCVVARTGQAGLTAFAVPADSHGVRVLPHRPAVGLRGFAFGELVFDRVHLPDRCRLGEVGQGLAAAYSSSVLYGRPNLTAVTLGLHRAAVDAAAEHARTTQRAGRALSEYDVPRGRLGAMHARLLTARAAAYAAADRLDRGLPCDQYLMAAKAAGVRAARQSTEDAMDLLGASALYRGPVERAWRDVRCMDAPAGTGDIQDLRLGQALLGDDRLPWSLRFRTPRRPRLPEIWRPR